MDLALVRHGESEANQAGLIQGRGDYRLSENGRRQARMTADALAWFEPNRIYTSPLARARETAEIMNLLHNTSIAVLPDLIEYNLGEFEGLSGDEVFLRFPHVKPGLAAGMPFHLLAPGGETDEEADLRAERAFDEILNSGLPRILVVSHLGILERIIKMLAPEDPHWQWPLKNCSITMARVSPLVSEIGCFNDVAHLA